MAIARLSVGIGSKGKAAPHAQYIAREGKYEKENDSLEKLEHTGHGNMPKWAEHDPNYFWQSADEHERKNGSTYREHVIALPRELDVNERHELIKDWIAQEIGDKHAYQYAIHNPPAMDGKEQPHCHLMFSERTRDGIERDPDQYFKRYNGKNPEKGGAKKANTGLSHADRKADLLAQRERWEQTCNKHLELAGSRQRISMKSLKEQGINRKPIDLTMSQLKDPKIKGAYQIMLDSANEYIALRQQTRKFMNPTKELAEQEKQAAVRQLNLESQKHTLEREKAQTQAKQAEAQAKAEQARPKTAKEFVERLSQEQRQKIKEISSKTISQYEADINNKAVELYEKATPPNRRAKPLFAHYAYSDMKEVQPYKSVAQREIHEKDPSRYKDYAKAIEVTNAIQDMERKEGYQRQAERIREPSRDQDRGR